MGAESNFKFEIGRRARGMEYIGNGVVTCREVYQKQNE